MDCNKSTSIAAVLAASIIMATTFSDQDFSFGAECFVSGLIYINIKMKI
jgi:hypothetical protein